MIDVATLLDPTIALEQARKQFESKWTIGPIGCTSTAPTGEPYTVVTSHGVKDEAIGQEAFKTAKEAITLWVYFIEIFGHGKRGVLYWREMPELDCYSKGWMVYSRLLISDKAVK